MCARQCLVRGHDQPSGALVLPVSNLANLHRARRYAHLPSASPGLTHAQLVSKHPPSELTLAGLLYHLALVEENWTEVRFSGIADREPWAGVDWDADPNWEFRTAETMAPEQLRARYREACERSRQVVAAAGGADQLSAQAARRRPAFLAPLGPAAPHRGDRSSRRARRLPPRGDRRLGRRVARRAGRRCRRSVRRR